jgi:hypothetical protein
MRDKMEVDPNIDMNRQFAKEGKRWPFNIIKYLIRR